MDQVTVKSQGVESAGEALSPSPSEPNKNVALTSHHPGKGRGRRQANRVGLIVVSLGLMLGAWWYGSTFFDSYILPPPSAVWESWQSAVDRDVWFSDLGTTIGHAAYAFAIVLAAGIPIGVIIGRSWVVEDLTRVYLIFLQTVPTVVLIALALIFVGTSSVAVIMVTVASTFTYFTLNVIQGTKAIDMDLVEMAKVYGAKELSLVRSVIVPSVVPYLLAGARIALGVTWQVTLFAEYLTGVSGVGFQVSTAQKIFDTAAVFQWGLSIVLLSVLFEYGFFRPIERRLTRHFRAA